MIRRKAGDGFAGRARRGLAADSRLQINEVNELIRLTAEFVGNHRGLALERGYDTDAFAAVLQRLNQTAEIADAGERTI